MPFNQQNKFVPDWLMGQNPAAGTGGAQGGSAKPGASQPPPQPWQPNQLSASSPMPRTPSLPSTPQAAPNFNPLYQQFLAAQVPGGNGPGMPQSAPAIPPTGTPHVPGMGGGAPQLQGGVMPGPAGSGGQPMPPNPEQFQQMLLQAAAGNRGNGGSPKLGKGSRPGAVLPQPMAGMVTR